MFRRLSEWVCGLTSVQNPSFDGYGGLKNGFVMESGWKGWIFGREKQVGNFPDVTSLYAFGQGLCVFFSGGSEKEIDVNSFFYNSHVMYVCPVLRVGQITCQDSHLCRRFSPWEGIIMLIIALLCKKKISLVKAGLVVVNLLGGGGRKGVRMCC